MKNFVLAIGVLVLLESGNLGRGAVEESRDLILTNAGDIHGLTRATAGLGRHVKLTGVVTYSDPLWSLLFVQDAFSGTFVSLSDGSYPTNSELVEITGRTDDGEFLPVVTKATWRHLGTGAIPKPREIVRFEQFARAIDSQWSKLEGVVIDINLDSGQNHYQIDLANENWRAVVFVPVGAASDPEELKSLVDRRIAVVGVAGVDYQGPQLSLRLKCFVPSTSLIRTLESAPLDPAALAIIAVSKLADLCESNTPLHRVKVRGVCTFSHAHELILQEKQSGLRVVPAGENTFRPGEQLEAVGFIHPGMFASVMEPAAVRRISESIQPEPPPALVSPAAVLWGGYDARLVHLKGVLQ